MPTCDGLIHCEVLIFAMMVFVVMKKIFKLV